MKTGDTILAVSSSSGPALRMIVRVSGPDAISIARRFTSEPRVAEAGVWRNEVVLGDMRVPAWTYTFLFPRSYTGEDLVEFHLPGNPLLASMFMREMRGAGARGAEPGEFTARAYFNGRIDLTAAEGVAALIAAGNEQELAAARRLMSGELARRIAPVVNALADALALLEVGIDFSDEDVTFISAPEILLRIERADAALAELLGQSARFERLTHQPVVVLAGRPNAGKSTLLNALAGHERAVVSAVAGTTRDVLSAEVTLRRGSARVVDVAGIGPGQADDSPIGRKMRDHALRAAEEADHVVLVRDITDTNEALTLPRTPDLIVHSKSELMTAQASDGDALLVSARTGNGLPALRDAIDRLCFGESSGGASLALNARHVGAIDEARLALSRARDQLSHGSEFVAHDLREALDALGSITGRVSVDDLLGRVFLAFCIGK